MVGKQLIQARAAARARRLRGEDRAREAASRTSTRWWTRTPNAGEEADEGSTVTLEVSGGPGNVLVPPVEGLTRAKAIRSSSGPAST